MFAIDTRFEYERSDLRSYIIACRLTCKRRTYHLAKIIARAVQKRYRIYMERGESFGRWPSPERRRVLRPKTFAPVFHFLLFLPLHKYTCILVRVRTRRTLARKSTLIFFFDNTICVQFISKNIVGSRLKCLFCSASTWHEFATITMNLLRNGDDDVNVFFFRNETRQMIISTAACGGSGTVSLASAPGKFRKERHFTE